jgi:fused signal recognition particle receptor
LLVLVLLIAGVGVAVARRSHTGQRPAPPEQGIEAPEAAPARGVVSHPSAEVAGAVLAGEIEPRQRFSLRLGRARAAFTGALASVFSRSALDDDVWEELEEALIGADVGVATTTAILEDLRLKAKEERAQSPREVLLLLKSELKQILERGDRALALEARARGPVVLLVAGVNGTGKTTTIGKLALQQHRLGKTVVLAAGDTFRAAAAEQLSTWADRAHAEVVRGQEGADPAAVVFDAVELAGARGYDICIVDTAGRLHTKSNLMEELKKIGRIIDRSSGHLTETLLVLDATTGQNGIAQAREFADAIGLSGIVLTKLDSSARGGVVIAIERELDVPVKLVGLGEEIDDLSLFDPDAFVEALFS